MGGGWERRWIGRLASAAAALALAAVVAAPAMAHGLFGEGDPADLVQDTLLTMAVPLVVLGIGALAGVLLSRWIAAHEHEQRAGDESDEAAEGGEETTEKATRVQ